jgi:uncharacterized protein with von Willebrand factor type A (vWA) domain
VRGGDALERAFEELDALPAGLFAPVVAHPIGALRARAAGVLAWRAALLTGRVPAEDLGSRWLPPGLHGALAEAVARLGVLPFCSGEPELVDLVLVDLLALVERVAPSMEDRIAEQLAALRAKERRDWEEPETPAGRSGGGLSTEVDQARTGEARGGEPDDARSDRGAWVGEQQSGEAPGSAPVDPEHAARLAAEAARLVLDDVAKELSDRLDGRWGERVAAWRRLADTLGDLRAALGLGFDLARRVLRDAGWREIPKFQALLDRTPQLRELVRSLGRMNAPRGPEEATVVAQVVDPVRRVVEELRLVRSPRAPTEARGIERSAEITRMLPAEAALLGHPTLRLLWHARRAERALATYRFEGRVEERVRVHAEAAPIHRTSHRLPERGPVVVCLDTSGSMQGAPEQIAKALTLAVARAAHEEGRACRVVLFSGPGDVEDLEVGLGPDGLPALLRLLTMSFSGGTDVDWPLRIALDTLERQGWDRADLLIVSDGAFDLPSGAIEAVGRARERHDARVHGLVVGVQASPAMAALCDPLHVFADWAAVGGV